MALVEYYGTGRRKTSMARVRLVPGTGAITVNKRPLDDYFPNNVLKMVIWRGVRLILASLVAGVALAFAVAHLLQGLLYGVSPKDPRIACIAALLLLLAGLTACYIPARRAMRVDPMVALRYE